MKIKVLASGSAGNLAIISTNTTNIMIDAGISHRMMMSRMNEEALKIDALLITHEHTDHARFLNTISKKLDCRVHMNHESFEKLYFKYREGITKDDIEHIDETEFMIGDILVKPIELSHDSTKCYGFIFKSDNQKIVYITDTGYLKNKYLEEITNANIYLLESNHDPEMVLFSERPFLLKQRIIGNTGHLSNETAANIINKVAGDKTKHLVFMHLSRECNSADLAKVTHQSILNNYEKYQCHYAMQDEPLGDICYDED